MRIVLFIFLLFLSATAYGQQVYEPDVSILERLNFMNREDRTPVFTYKQIGVLTGDTTDYIQWVGTFMWNDTLYMHMTVGNAHDGVQKGKAYIVKYDRGRDLFTTATSFNQIPDSSRSIAYNVINDTIYCFKYSNTVFTADTILMLDKNFNRLGAFPFDRTVFGTPTWYVVSKIIDDGSGNFIVTGYTNNPTYRAHVLRSTNRGRNWSVRDSVVFSAGVIRPEEPYVVKAGDSLFWYIGSDFGGRTWKCASADGLSWSDPELAFPGRNHGNAIYTSTNVLVAAPARFVAYSFQGEEVQAVPTSINLDDSFVDGATYYNNMVVSFNRQTYTNRIMGKYRSEHPAKKNIITLNEGSSVIELGEDTVRYYYCEGPGGLTYRDFSDLSYIDVKINRTDSSFVLLGGVSAIKQTFYPELNYGQSSMTDTFQQARYKGFYTYYDIFRVSGNHPVGQVVEAIDTGGAVVPVTKTDSSANFTVFNTFYASKLGINTTFPIATGRNWDFRNTGGTEQFAGVGGNIAYQRGGNFGGAFRLITTGGTINAVSQTMPAAEIGPVSFSGHNGTARVDAVELMATAMDTFKTTKTYTQFWIKKIVSTSDKYPLVIDLLNRTSIGNYSAVPTASFMLNVGGSMGIVKDSLPGNDTVQYVLGINQSTNQVVRRVVPTSVATLTGLTQAQILFGSANGQVRQSANLSYDSANLRLTLANNGSFGRAPGHEIIFDNSQRVVYSSGAPTNSVAGHRFVSSAVASGTSGTTDFLQITGNYSPTSGTGVYNQLAITPTINQTGGANGISRSVYISPTLTRAEDFRAIEVMQGKTILRDSVRITYTPASSSNSDSTLVKDASTGLLKVKLSNYSGTYTPTLTGVSNVDASTAYTCQYNRVGNTVTVSGKLDIDPTLTTTATELGISLPIVSALTAEEQVGGTAFCGSIAGMGAAIAADATNDRAKLVFISTDINNNSMFFTFTYLVQ